MHGCAGTTPETNQRIKLAALSETWKASKEYGPGNAADSVPFLDAGIVAYNMRDRKLQGRPMTFIKPKVRSLAWLAAFDSVHATFRSCCSCLIEHQTRYDF